MKLKINDRFVVHIFNIIFFWFLFTPILKSVPFGEIFSRAIGVVVLLLSSIVIANRPIPKAYLRLSISALLFLLYCIFHTVTGEDISGNIATLIRIYGTFALLFTFLTINSSKTLEIIETKIFYLGSICAAYVIAQSLIYKLSPQLAIDLLGAHQYWGALGESVRPRGLLNSVGGSASLIATSIIIRIKRSAASDTDRREKLLTFLLIVGLALIFTRTFILLIIIFSILHFTITNNLRKLTGLILVCVFLFSAYSIYSPEKLAERLSDLPFISKTTTSTDQLFKGRFHLSKIPWEEYKSQDVLHWIWGNNLNHSTNILINHYESLDETLQSSTHNDFIWLLVNLGAMGLVLYLLFIFRLLSLSRNKSLKLKSITFLYILLFFFLSSLAGESINITGHRYIQIIFIALLISKVQQEKSVVNRHPSTSI